ncbi:MAG: multicopper oxidase domain-containing protein, partial [Lentisphaeria bacterium]|nr:multicopper oxidase domain-containing protein [Lentisphaeria bacterium]
MRRTILSALFLVTGLLATEQHFYLSIEENFTVTLPDSTVLPAWAFQLDDGAPSIPGPVLAVQQGDEIVIHFQNTSSQTQTLHFHGLDVDASQDGFPGLANSVPAGESAIFQFTANHAGSFAYVAMGDGPRSRQMGLYGIIKVHLFNLGTEYDLISQGVDPDWHTAEPEN